nr:Insertion element protein [Rhizohabitans arisaemae]
MSERAVPFHCPYCGEEDLEPYENTHGGWYCRSCARAFVVKFIGVGVRI